MPMKAFLAIITTSFLILISLTPFLVQTTLAAEPSLEDYGLDAARGQAKLPKTVFGDAKDIPSIVGKVIQIGLSLLGILFFLLVLYAGFIWMKARGNTEEVEKAKAIIEGAIIGLVIVSAAYAITSFVFTSIATGAS